MASSRLLSIVPGERGSVDRADYYDDLGKLVRSEIGKQAAGGKRAR